MHDWWLEGCRSRSASANLLVVSQDHKLLVEGVCFFSLETFVEVGTISGEPLR